MSVELQSRASTEDSPDAGTITSLPILILNIHENCNCKCRMCDIWRRPAGSELSLDTIRSYEESIRSLGVQQVALTGGEPLLHSQLPELLSRLKLCGVRLTLLSSGLLLRKKAAMIVDYVDEIIVSLDGPPEIHDAIRGVSRAFELVQGGIQALRQISNVPVHARCTIQKANFKHLRATVEAVKAAGCRTISFLAVDTSSHAFNRDLIWPIERQNGIGLSCDEVQVLDNEVALLISQRKTDFDTGFIVENPDKLRRIASYFRRLLGELPLAAPTCNAPWVSAVVQVNGSVRPCFFHPEVGHTMSLTLDEALNTEAAIAFRQTLDIESNPVCKRCVCSLNYRA